MGGTANSGSVTNVGGTLKLAPGDLPGHHGDDVLPPPATAWDDDYLWRIAAYNPVTAPLTSRPRPLITATSTDPSTGLLNISYTMQAHPRLTSASIPYSTDYYGGRHPFGYQVSSAYLRPQWVGDAAIDWISDRCAPAVDGNVSRQINSNNWTWIGKDRRRPSLFHDDDKMLYVGFVTKPDPGMAGRYRPWAFAEASAASLRVRCVLRFPHGIGDLRHELGQGGIGLLLVCHCSAEREQPSGDLCGNILGLR